MVKQTVRVYDPKTDKATTIPANELASGMIRARIEGREDLGEVFIDSRQLKAGGGPMLHPPFPEEYKPLFRQLSELFFDFYPKTPEQWEEGFRQDANPANEIEIWRNMAGAFVYFTEGKKYGRHKRGDIFHLILATFTNGPQSALATVQLKALSRERAAQIVRRIVRGNVPKRP